MSERGGRDVHRGKNESGKRRRWGVWQRKESHESERKDPLGEGGNKGRATRVRRAPLRGGEGKREEGGGRGERRGREERKRRRRRRRGWQRRERGEMEEQEKEEEEEEEAKRRRGREEGRKERDRTGDVYGRMSMQQRGAVSERRDGFGRVFPKPKEDTPGD